MLTFSICKFQFESIRHINSTTSSLPAGCCAGRTCVGARWQLVLPPTCPVSPSPVLDGQGDCDNLLSIVMRLCSDLFIYLMPNTGRHMEESRAIPNTSARCWNPSCGCKRTQWEAEPVVQWDGDAGVGCADGNHHSFPSEQEDHGGEAWAGGHQLAPACFSSCRDGFNPSVEGGCSWIHNILGESSILWTG